MIRNMHTISWKIVYSIVIAGFFLVIPFSQFTVISEPVLDSNTVFQSGEYEAYEGYTLFAPEYFKNTYLMKNDGTIINMWKSNNAQALGTYLLDNGNLIRSCTRLPNPYFPTGGFTGRVELFDWDGNLLWYYEYSNKTVLLHHDIEVLPNGNVLMLAWEEKTAEEAIAAGRNPNDINMGELWPDHIIEVEPIYPSGGNIVWEWHVWEHLIQDYDETKNNYGNVGEHPELIDINFDGRKYTSVHADIHHINSIDYNEELDQILLCVHNFCEIWVIDHSTTTEEAAGHAGGRYGKGGDLLYRWGNPQAYRAGADEDQYLWGSHDAQWIEEGLPGEGNILIYNNGLVRPEGKYSSIEEITPPIDDYGNYYLEEGSSFGPVSPSWKYTAPNKTDFYSEMISGVQRLPNGNTLICEGNHGYFFEVTEEKEKVWDFYNSISASSSNPFSDDVFKIRRYPLDYSGIGEIHYQNPEQPLTPNGDTMLKTGTTYTFTSSAMDPNDDDLIYLFDWGDGTDSGWIGSYDSGEQVSASHSWSETGSYQIRVKAKDNGNLESSWSESLTVTVESYKVWLFGKIDSKTVTDNEIRFWADSLMLFSFNPFHFENYPLGVHMTVDPDYKGILTDRVIAGRFYKK